MRETRKSLNVIDFDTFFFSGKGRGAGLDDRKTEVRIYPISTKN